MLRLVSFNPSHWPEVQKIYQEGIDTGLATFETLAPDYVTWNEKFLPVSRLVCVTESDSVCGWAGLQAVSKREAYKGVAEVTLYVDLNQRGQGVGAFLMEALVQSSESNGFWMLTASIFEENKPSIALHEKFGFHTVGRRERIGFRDGRWVTTVIMDRRSQIVGV